MLQMEDWEEEMDRLLMALPIVGCMFKKTYFDSVKGRNVSEIVWPKEVVVNYWAKTVEDAERITHCLQMTDNDVYERIAGGVYLDLELEKDRSLFADSEKVTDEVTGVQQPVEDDSTLPYLLLESHCLIDLDGDGYKEPYVVTIDAATKQVLRIVARFTESDVVYNTDGKVVRISPLSYFTKFRTILI